MTKSDILKALINHYSHGNKAQFAKMLGISAQGLSTWISRDTFDIDIVYSKCNEISADWLLTGEGEMFKGAHTPVITTHEPKRKMLYSNTLNHTSIVNDASPDNQVTQLKPRIPFKATAGMLSMIGEGAALSDCEMRPAVNYFPNYDFTMIIQGDSMAPDYQSGDEMVCRFVRESAFIQWGRVYIIDTNDGAVLKRVYNNGDSITCRSINPTYPDFDIPKSEILRMALVIGLIRCYL